MLGEPAGGGLLRRRRWRRPSPVEKQVLDLLDRLGKDEVAARAMGVSVRTFRGYVADLMARLGAADRFQVGARAKERGWI